jgi:hypothetical protein
VDPIYRLMLTAHEGRMGLWEFFWELANYNEFSPRDRASLAYRFVKYGLESGLLVVEEELVSPFQQFTELDLETSLEAIQKEQFWIAPEKGQLTIVVSLSDKGESVFQSIVATPATTTDLLRKISQTDINLMPSYFEVED